MTHGLPKPSDVIQSGSGIPFLPNEDIYSYTVSRDNSTSDIFDFAEMYGKQNERKSNTCVQAVGCGGNLETKTCDTLTTADSRKPLGLPEYHLASLQSGITTEIENDIVPKRCSLSNSNMSLERNENSLPIFGHPEIGSLSNYPNPNMYSTFSPRRSHPGFEQLPLTDNRQSNTFAPLIDEMQLKGSYNMPPESETHNIQTVGQLSAPSIVAGDRANDIGQLGYVPFGSVPGQFQKNEGGLEKPEGQEIQDDEPLTRHITSLNSDTFNQGAFDDVPDNMPYYHLTDDHLYMESASSLTTPYSKNTESQNNAKTLDNVMLGDPKSICSEIGGGGGPWRDILEEMAGSLSGEYYGNIMASSDNYNNLGGKNRLKADGMSEHENLMDESHEGLKKDFKSSRKQGEEQRAKFTEIEAALQNLTPDDLEQRRARMFGITSSDRYGRRYERGESITSDGFDSPGKLIRSHVHGVNLVLQYLFLVVMN